MAFVVEKTVTVEQVTELVQKTSSLPVRVEWFDTYVGKGVAEGKKSLAFHLTFQDPARTLSTEEVEEQVKRVTEALAKNLRAEIRA